MPTVALANEFLEAYSKLPRQQQKKVRTFTEKFQADPTSAAINYEKLHGVKDDKVRTVRIDQKYRAVILHPENGHVHVLMWVDNHDEAMAWAQNKQFSINPATGTLQIVNVAEAEAVVEKETPSDGTLFASFDDDTLLSFGVPPVLLPAIRAVGDDDSLLQLATHLPPEVAEALTWLADGFSVEEVQEAVAQPKTPKEVDPDDLEAALEKPDTKRRFVMVKNVSELDRILDAPLEKWRIFLHPSQEALVQKSFNGPARVLGGAGTGKTVVAMHRARHLAQNASFRHGDRILFTTFTANLAHNVEQNLKQLCGPEFERIEVRHLHSWAVRFMRGHNQQFNIANEEEIQACWENAILNVDRCDRDIAFLRQEWQEVVQGNGIEERSNYLKVARTGRGQTLSRQQRAGIWKVFEEYRHQLRSIHKVEWLDVIRKTRQYLEFKPDSSPYRAVIVDEAQDFHPEEWRLIRAIVPTGKNDLFIVGDAHQRIYGRKVVLSHCGIDVRGRAFKLRINYRTTEQIRAWAVSLLKGIRFDDLDGHADTEEDYRSLLAGPVPEVRVFESAAAEKEHLAKAIPVLLEQHAPEEICLVARTSRLLEGYTSLLDRIDVPYVILDKNNDEAGKGIRLGTMHRVKGLEFPCMILASVNADVMPLKLSAIADDDTALQEHEARERSLLFVAATRARDRALVTAWGEPSKFLRIDS